MPGWLLLVPFLMVRFGLLAVLNRDAIRTAAHFAPMHGKERLAYWLYQLSNLGVLVCPFFLRVRFEPWGWFYAGLATYVAGIVLLSISIVNFAAPADNGFRTKGLYRFSRNPMYVAYFITFIGCALLTQSPVLLGVVLVFQAAAHWVIRSEERWCIEQFGEAYRQYMRRVRRYI